MSGALSPDVRALRRTLHRVPELGFQESVTSALLARELGAIGGAHPMGQPRPIAATGWVVDLGPADAARTLLLRADMDGLPIREATGLDYASEHEGRMHACGHDAHMAALVFAARHLAEHTPPGVRLRLLFQPAEEGKGGALRCIDEGVLDGVDAAFGLHVWNELPLGTVAATAGGIMAGVVDVSFRVIGRGGHGALPDRTRDPIIAASRLVLALQTVISREESPLAAAVMTIGMIHAGDAFNVIPDEATLRGTVRAFDPAQEERLRAAISRVAAGVAMACDVQIEVDWQSYAAPTVNDPGMAALAARVCAGVDGVREVRTDYRTMAGEDFGDFLAEVPGCFLLVGSGDPAGGSEPHHSPRFEIDEGVLPLATALHIAMARAWAELG
ncbi:MAG: amidohydrolase [Deltaproteobacteria bacterium]|nr:amidohydrolase [Deltaproteobacteria bacterium]MCB9788118.1 amidohydrolase [Deltaproteobacteria bacterium]